MQLMEKFVYFYNKLFMITIITNENITTGDFRLLEILYDFCNIYINNNNICIQIQHHYHFLIGKFNIILAYEI